MTELQTKIKELRLKGFSFRKIAKTIPCSLSTVSRTLSDNGKERENIRLRRVRRNRKGFFVNHFGGKCILCGYSKCLAVLEFHHRDNSTKRFSPSNILHGSVEKALIELEKCDLMCANCHREKHNKSL